MSKLVRDIREYDYEKLKRRLKLYFYVSLAILALVLLIFGVIQIQFLFESNYQTSLVFTIMNSFSIGVFFNVFGVFNKGTNNKGMKVLIFSMLIIIFITGFGFADIRVIFNIPFIFHPEHNIFSTGSVEGMYFVSYNLYIFIVLIVLSFFIESEKIE